MYYVQTEAFTTYLRWPSRGLMQQCAALLPTQELGCPGHRLVCPGHGLVCPGGSRDCFRSAFQEKCSAPRWKILSKTTVCWNSDLPESLLLKIFVLHSPVWWQCEQHRVQPQFKFKMEIKRFSISICKDLQAQAFICFTYLHILYLAKKKAAASLLKYPSFMGQNLTLSLGLQWISLKYWCSGWGTLLIY